MLVGRFLGRRESRDDFDKHFTSIRVPFDATAIIHEGLR
jgi:hypothetical protein